MIGLNAKYRDWAISFNKACLIGLTVFGFLLPVISITAEFKVVELQKGPMDDIFTMAYTYLRFPLYWTLYFLQTFFLGISKRIRNEY